jgi:glycosidase
MKALNRLKLKLDELARTQPSGDYLIPYIWSDPSNTGKTGAINVNPFLFYSGTISGIIHSTSSCLTDPDYDNIIYNAFVRFTTAYDHNGDSAIDTNPLKSGLRETGTFLKMIALLPYIKSLGCNILYLLPITSIGKMGRKGNLGSPYAIRNPYMLDENLAEPVLELGVEVEFTALVEAAHLFGIKVILEFVFRTASLDSDWSTQHPEWFYWIESGIKNREPHTNDTLAYGPPIFEKKALNKILKKVKSGHNRNLPKPTPEHLNMFTSVPQKVVNNLGDIFGLTENGTKCKVPGAFADWPPNDTQPPWTDVTYLRIYDKPDFNYIAYNTIRMYDIDLAKPKYMVKELWDTISDIIPHYQNRFDIDGVMIDMGHALPEDLLSRIIKKAVRNKRDFTFWEENFSITKESVEKGYSAVVGYLPFDLHHPGKMHSFIDRLESGDLPVNIFLTGENHNTPRVASRNGKTALSLLEWALVSLLPGLPFIHSGFELGEKVPVNTGLDFQPEDLDKYPPEKLALFSVASIGWDNVDNSLFNEIRKLLIIRKKYIPTGFKKGHYSNLNAKQPHKEIVAFSINLQGENRRLVYIANYSSDLTINQTFELDSQIIYAHQVYGKAFWGNDGSELKCLLEPLDFVIIELITKL